MNWGLKDKTVEEIRAILAKRPQVEKAILYGSRAKGNYKANSDVDLVLVGTDLTSEVLGQIQTEFYDGPFPYRFDLSILSQITHSDLLEHIERAGVLFYESNPVLEKPAGTITSIAP